MTEERRKELDEFMFNETNDSETQEWRDDLTLEELEYVNAEDERYDKALDKVFARINELLDKRS